MPTAAARRRYRNPIEFPANAPEGRMARCPNVTDDRRQSLGAQVGSLLLHHRPLVRICARQTFPLCLLWHCRFPKNEAVPQRERGGPTNWSTARWHNAQYAIPRCRRPRLLDGEHRDDDQHDASRHHQQAQDSLPALGLGLFDTRHRASTPDFSLARAAGARSLELCDLRRGKASPATAVLVYVRRPGCWTVTASFLPAGPCCC